MNKVYESKKDQWLVLVTWFSIIVIVLSVIFLVVTTGITTYSLVYSGLMFPVAVFLYYVLNSTYYVVNDTELHVRCLFFKWRIPFDTVTEIFPTSNMLSSPALSLDRLMIIYGDRRKVMISPEDKTVFLQDIASRNPDLKVEGETLVNKRGS